MEINNNKLIIRANSSEMGNVEEKMEIENETENNIKISFSAKFMLDALKMFDSEQIYLLLNGEISPIILKNIDTEEMIQLILPMKTY
jgi:DNA polymerase-3 subunit beta